MEDRDLVAMRIAEPVDDLRDEDAVVETIAVQPMPGFAQSSVGSMDDVGTRNGCAISVSKTRTKSPATANVSTHSTTVRRIGRRVAAVS